MLNEQLIQFVQGLVKKGWVRLSAEQRQGCWKVAQSAYSTHILAHAAYKKQNVSHILDSQAHNVRQTLIYRLSVRVFAKILQSAYFIQTHFQLMIILKQMKLNRKH